MSLRNRVLTFGRNMVLSKRRKPATHSHALVPQKNGLWQFDKEGSYVASITQVRRAQRHPTITASYCVLMYGYSQPAGR